MEASEIIEKEAKEEKGGFYCILLGISSASLSGNTLAWKETVATNQRGGKRKFRSDEGAIIVRQDF